MSSPGFGTTNGNGFSFDPDQFAHRSIIHTVSGASPLLIPNAYGGDPNRVVIRGNSINGVGVGDKTPNLLPSYICRPGPITVAPPDSEWYTIRATLAYPFPIAAGKTYTICAADPNTAIKAFVQTATGYNSETMTFSGTSNIPGFPSWKNLPTPVTIPTSVSAPFMAITFMKDGNLTITAEEATALKLYIVEGSYTAKTAPAYEPCGYRIPVNIQSSSSGISPVFYTDSPLYTPGDIFMPACGALPLYTGDNILTVNTSVAPSSVEVTYRML